MFTEFERGNTLILKQVMNVIKKILNIIFIEH